MAGMPSPDVLLKRIKTCLKAAAVASDFNGHEGEDDAVASDFNEVVVADAATRTELARPSPLVTQTRGYIYKDARADGRTGVPSLQLAMCSE